MTKVTWLPFYESLSKYNISDLITEILIQFLEELGIREPKNVEDLFQCIIDSDEMGFKENDELIQLIECFLKKKPSSRNGLLLYARILKEKKNINMAKEVLEQLVAHPCDLYLLLECINNAIENNSVVPENFNQLLYKYLEDPDPNIRYLSFKGLSLNKKQNGLKSFVIEKFEKLLD